MSINTATIRVMNRLCHTDCPFSDGLVYASNPPKCKCELTGEYHFFGDECNVKESDTNVKPINNNIYADKEKDIKVGSITVKGFDSLVNALKVLLDNHYKILIKKDGFNKYNESTLLTIEYYTEPKESDKVAQEAYHDYLVNKALTNSQSNSTTINNITDITATSKAIIKEDVTPLVGYADINDMIVGSIEGVTNNE